MPKVTSDMTISDVLNMDRNVAEVFIKHGLHCLGCPHATGESIADASTVHGIDAETLVADLNGYFDANL